MNTLRARLDKAGTSIQALADYLAMNYSTVQRAVKMNEPPKRRLDLDALRIMPLAQSG